MEDSNAVQNSLCAFGTSSIIYNGEIISHHPISNTRFENIMKKKIIFRVLIIVVLSLGTDIVGYLRSL
ncbi:MAG: YoaP domain-containing protein [Thermoplasmatales archaeon]|nr:MAG: YoaP domain-containing protein [Thermoplasmatales archaeon]